MDNPQGNTVSEVRASTAHTPGPWEAREDCTNAVTIYSDGETIADVFNRDFDEVTEEVRANARLIAAAPDMLTLLKRFNCHSIGMNDFYREVRAVLAKATATTDTHRDSVNERGADREDS